MALTSDHQALAYLHKLLAAMVKAGGSDLFISAGSPPSIKVNGLIQAVTEQILPAEFTEQLAHVAMTENQRHEFASEKECNFAIRLPDNSRFRVNVLMQQQKVSMVIRVIASEMPTMEKLDLPEVLKEVIMAKRGLLLVVGGTGSGKSTSLAAMIDYRNQNSAGHIITIEDPVEYIHTPKRCLVTHREVGIDTHSWHHALKNTLRQAPDLILIGEIRDTETMEHAIAFAETGHLCLGTLHANSANQAIDRIINFFSEEKRNQLLMDLSSNLKGIISQRLVRTEDQKGRKAAIEILLNSPLVSERLAKGEYQDLKSVMAKSREIGMRTFDWALFDLYNRGFISYEEAIRNADSANELRINIKLRSQRGEPESSTMPAAELSIGDHDAEQAPAQQPGKLTPAEEAMRAAELERQSKRRAALEEKLKAMQAARAAASATPPAPTPSPLLRELGMGLELKLVD